MKRKWLSKFPKTNLKKFMRNSMMSFTRSVRENNLPGLPCMSLMTCWMGMTKPLEFFLISRFLNPVFFQFPGMEYGNRNREPFPDLPETLFVHLRIMAQVVHGKVLVNSLKK